MKSKLFVIATAAILVVLNLLIWQKQTTLRSGQTVLLELAPVDPRSLIQGDYMRLRYRLENEIVGTLSEEEGMVIKLDARGVGHFARIYAYGPLAAGEVRLRARMKGHRLLVASDAYYFQEGEASLYLQARYGEFRVGRDGDAVLVGLADEELHHLGGR